MTFDFIAILNQLKAFLQGILIKDLPLIEETGLGYLSSAEQRLSQLATNAASGQLSTEDVMQALIEEKDIFIQQIKSFEVIGLSLSQQAINNAEDVVMGILGAVIPKQP